MDLISMFSQVIPRMIISWFLVMLFIAGVLRSIRRFRWVKNRIKILSSPNLHFEKFSLKKFWNKWKFSSLKPGYQLLITYVWQLRVPGGVERED